MEAETLFRLKYNSEDLLELRLGLAQSWRRMLRGQDLHRIPGFLGGGIGAGNTWELQEWRFDRFISHRENAQENNEDYYYALGSRVIGQESTEPFYGRSVSELTNGEFLQPDFLMALVSFLVALCEQYQKLGYQQKSVIWDSLLYKQSQIHGPQFVVLPPELVHFVAQRSSEEARLQQMIPYQLPVSGQSNSQCWAYALAVLLFVKLCDQLPFRAPAPKNPAQQNCEERLHDAVVAMRSSHYIRAQLFCSKLSDLWDQLLQNILCAPQMKQTSQVKAKGGQDTTAAAKRLPGLECWQQALNSFSENSPCSLWRECNEKQRQQAVRDLNSECRNRKQSWQRQNFWRKKRNLLATYLVSAIVVAALIYTPLKRALSPPKHRNYSAYDTAMLYYQAMDRLDPQLHDQLSYKGNTTVKADSNMLTILFVNTQIRQGYEGREVLLRADNWLKQEGLSAHSGSPLPALSLDFVLYGISDISIDTEFPTAQQLARDSPLGLEQARNLVDDAQVTLKANYNFWLPGTFGERSKEQKNPKNFQESLLQPLHRQNTDAITLVYRARKQAWYVHGIQRSSQEIEHPLP